jgi:predicted permease
MDPVFVEDFPPPEGQLPRLRRYKWLGQGYFETMGNPLIAGRAIDWRDIHSKAPVVMVSENYAREIWGEPSKAIGRRIRNTPKNPWREIVGVAGDERDDGVAQPAPAIVYWPLLIKDFWTEPVFAYRNVAYAVRSARLGSTSFLEELQQAVWSVNPNLPLASVRTLDDIRAESMAQTSFALVMLVIAGAVALLLGVVGIYGVIAYIAAQRTREIGVRMALGAQPGDVRRLFVRHGLVLTAVGVVLGVSAAAAVTRLMSSLLFGVAATDMTTYSVTSVGLGSIALLASYLPARRAARIDPVVALRTEV